MLPNFLVIGAMKTGTSSLYRYLRDHPQVFMTHPKEPRFFGSNWDRGLGWYQRLFDGAESASAIGEASTEYSVYPYFPDVPSRIASLLPDVRLVYLVRHPIERMVSEYQVKVFKGLEDGASPEEALLKSPDLECKSRYAMQVERYLDHFPLDQMIILKAEDLRHDRLHVMRRVFRHLSVDGSWEPPKLWEEFNQSSAKRRRRSADRLVRRVPGYRAIRKVAPPWLREVKERLLTSEAPPRPELSDRAQSELEGRLRDDVRRLRRYMVEPFDGWGIA